MEIWVFVGCFAAVLLGAALLVTDKKQQQKEEFRIRRMRDSLFYQNLGREVRRLRDYGLDQILVERDQIIFRGIRPPEVLSCFRMADHGLRFLNERKLRTLTMLLSEDIPDLADHRKYHLHSYHTRRPNGMKDRAWEYVVTSRYKARFLREYQWNVADLGNFDRH